MHHKRLERKKKKTEEAGTRIKERCTPTRPEEAARERRCRREILFPLKCHTSVLGKCFYLPMHHSGFRKHGSFCLQKQKCFIIKGLLLTQNLNSNSYCKSLLPDIVFVTADAKISNPPAAQKEAEETREGCSRCWPSSSVPNCCLKFDILWITVYLL